jgi:hypothetical protein
MKTDHFEPGDLLETHQPLPAQYEGKVRRLTWLQFHWKKLFRGARKIPKVFDERKN